jgi:hypothetical protein
MQNASSSLSFGTTGPSRRRHLRHLQRRSHENPWTTDTEKKVPRIWGLIPTNPLARLWSPPSIAAIHTDLKVQTQLLQACRTGDGREDGCYKRRCNGMSGCARGCSKEMRGPEQFGSGRDRQVEVMASQVPQTMSTQSPEIESLQIQPKRHRIGRYLPILLHKTQTRRSLRRRPCRILPSQPTKVQFSYHCTRLYSLPRILYAPP